MRPVGVRGRGGADLWTFDCITVPVIHVVVEGGRTVGAQRRGAGNSISKK